MNQHHKHGGEVQFSAASLAPKNWLVTTYQPPVIRGKWVS